MADTTASRTGLFTAQAVAIPLSGVTVDVDISRFCARVVVTQRYVNRESTPIEAVYVFPLDEGAAVCGFEAIIDGTLVVGEVKEREAAFEMYDRAIEAGHGAFLLDEERPDVFQASIGNLLPGKEVLVKLTYVTELAVAASGLRFSIPTTVSPRYAPAQDQSGIGRPDSEALNPPVAWEVPYGLNLSIRLAMTGPISRIESLSHPVAVAVNGNDATVTLSTRDTALDRDFVLSVDAAGLDTPQAWIEAGDDGEQAVAVGFVPNLGDAPTPCDVTFLVDRSGSMAGPSIAEVRNALQLCLRSMIPGCTFNIVGFGSRYEALFPSSRAYDEKSLAEASAHVTRLEADLGGTEILPALEFVLDQPRYGERLRQVVVLTDGEVTNTDAVIELARKHVDHARVFAFGIGAGSSQHLVKGMARAGRGAAEFIYPGEPIEPKVMRQFSRLLSPALTDVRMNWGALEARQAPSVVPPVFSGGRLLLYAFVNEIRTHVAPTRVELALTSPSGPQTFAVDIDPSCLVHGRTVATLAARARIRELEESPEWTSSRGSRQRERKEAGVSKEIIALSMRYGLMSRETSFVAVERRETPVQGDMQLRRVPIALTTGWGGLKGRSPFHLTERHEGASRFLTLGAPGAVPELSESRLLGGDSSSAMPAHSRFIGRAIDGIAEFRQKIRGGREESHASAPLESPSETGSSDMHRLIALQHADGSWDLTRELAQIIGRDLAELESALAGATGDPAEVTRAWATALALVWLRLHARDVEAQWQVLARKARRWLGNVRAGQPDRVAWIDAAEKLLTAGASTHRC
jgi:Vault protein inter-alpha-trypsin domain/von Willebrand factor type A domain